MTRQTTEQLHKGLKQFLKDSILGKDIGKKGTSNKLWIIDQEEEKALKIVVHLLKDCY